MAGSQLKRLKASLREQGITGPQQSKKQKRKLAQDEQARNEKRLKRGAVLEGIREQFNPFDLKHAAKPKFEVTSNRMPTGNAARGISGRPGEAKAASEERRRQTLLVDMQRRNKVGGILDRRFGEDDPTMTPEDKMLERFAREKQRSHKNSALFDLEDDDEPMEGLTHGGKSLTFDDDPVDDFDEDDLDDGMESDTSDRGQQRLKRLRALAAADGESDAVDEEPDRKKSKKEVMEEVIAKSKMHKYERQAAKEEDADLRAELDKELPNIQMLLSSNPSGSKRRADAAVDPTIVGGVNRNSLEKNYDLEVKRLAQDKRAQPSNRTKTEEELVEEESKRLRELEDKRQRRMRGEEVTDSEDEDESPKKGAAEFGSDAGDDEDDDFGLGQGIKTKTKHTAAELGFDDEDDFIIDDDLVASGSDIGSLDSDDIDEDDEEEDGSAAEDGDDDDDEFTKGLLSEIELRNPTLFADSSIKAPAAGDRDEHGLPFTFPCPSTSAEFKAVAAPYPHENLVTIVKRIRTLYHPKFDSKNKERLGKFSTALVSFIASEWDQETSPPFSVLESLVRHIHSLAKMFPVEISNQFRAHIEEISKDRPLALHSGDLVMLTAVGIIFPTSDHFHQVVTPSMLTLARFLGQKVPQSLADLATGTYLSILSLQFQQLSKRFVPEVLNFTLNTLCALAPAVVPASLGRFPLHKSPAHIRIAKASGQTPRRLTFADCVDGGEGKQAKADQVAILDTTLQVLDAAADTWAGKEAFLESFSQVRDVSKHLLGKNCRSQLPKQVVDRAEKLQAKLERMLGLARLSRRPLELHHHRPLAIKTFVPKFEETFDPDKHYDPDRERAELAKLKKEHKKERKGAMRELRKDANFMAREKLRLKKAKDEAYEKKYKRLVAEIQSEEGRESNAYEREKAARKRSRDR